MYQTGKGSPNIKPGDRSLHFAERPRTLWEIRYVFCYKDDGHKSQILSKASTTQYFGTYNAGVVAVLGQ